MGHDDDTLRETLRITCADAVELVTHFIDDALSTQDRERFEQHLHNCEPCTVYLDQIRMTITIVGRTAHTWDYPVAPDDMDELVSLFRARTGSPPGTEP